MDLIYSFNEISHILIDFECITKFRIGLFDNHFHEILSYPSRLSNFCKTIRSDESLNLQCQQCDYHSFQHCKSHGHSYVYQCHLGLTEIIVPIQTNISIIGYLMCGQIFTQNISYENFIRQYPHISSTSVDLKQLKSTLHNKKIVTKDIIASTTRFMNILHITYHMPNTFF